MATISAPAGDAAATTSSSGTCASSARQRAVPSFAKGSSAPQLGHVSQTAELPLSLGPTT